MSGFGGMERPGTRGQGTAQRTAMGSRAGLGTASRPGSASRRGVGVALNTSVNVADRPVTQQGLGGVRPTTQSAGRRVSDKNYWLGILRQSIEKIRAEIDAINKRIEDMYKDSGQSQQLERRYEELVKEIRDLQGDLADHNLVVDKAGSNTDPGEIGYYMSVLRNKNQQEKANVDNIFKEKQRRERELFDIDQQIADFQNANEARMNELSPEEKQRYLELQEENTKLQQQISSMQENIDELNMHIHHHEEELRSDPSRVRMADLMKRKKELEQEKVTLQAQAQSGSLDALRVQVKSDNMAIETLTRDIKGAEDKLDQKKSKLEQLIGEIKSGAFDENAQKYEKLLQKEREMKDFIDSFEDTKEKELQNIQENEQMIVAILEHISSGMESAESAPSKERFEEMKKDLEFKERQMQDAKGTFSNLQQEKELREMELEKIKTLDKKISVELEALNGRIQSMKDELIVFGDLDKLQSEFDNRKQELLQKRQNLGKMVETMTQQVQLLGAKAETKKRELQKSDTFNDLEKMEMKMKHHEQNIFSLSEFILMKSRESNYEEVLDHVRKTVVEINDILKENQKKI